MMAARPLSWSSQVKASRPAALKAHAQRGHHPGLQPVGKAAGQRREQGHDHGLGDQDQAGAARGKALDVLQVEAQQEADGEGGAVVDQRRQVGKGEDGVAAQQARLENGVGAARLPAR